MKKKDEIKADKRLKELGATPRIYHFEAGVRPFTAITIADNVLTWDGARRVLDNILPGLCLHSHEKATRLREELRRRYIYGVAICDQRDQLNRQRGRTIAKGRLWKYLKPKGVK
jgi:hypothetical protein